MPAVTPIRAPEAMTDPGAALNEILLDLGEACDLDWVGRPPGVCNSLQVKLDAAASSLAQGDTTSATGQLQAFVNELDAQRGQHVSENAYWLLKVNVEYVLEKLQP